MEYWTRVRFDYCGDPTRNHLQEIKTNHYYRDNDDGTFLHINVPKSVKVVNGLDKAYALKKVTNEEFNKVLKDTVDYMKINVANHKFI